MDPQPYSEKTDFRHPQQRGATQAQLLPAELLEEALAASHAAGELPRYANNEMISGVTPAHHAGAVAPPYWEKRMLFSLFGVRVRSVVSLTTEFHEFAGRALATSFRVQMDPPSSATYVAPTAAGPHPSSGNQPARSPAVRKPDPPAPPSC